MRRLFSLLRERYFRAQVTSPTVVRPQLVTKPQLRECPGCGLFQIVPALEADMRSNCARCGTVLRLTRADPLNRHLALTFAALVLFAVLWLAMLMKVSTAGIVHETTLESGPI
jgi:paraquat-inducible protein A